MKMSKGKANFKILSETPFPWFGRKQKVAKKVWVALGDVDAYTEPFGGAAAVLLARPKSHGVRVETLNDLDGLLINFWRSVKYDPKGVAEYCGDPPQELTKNAFHLALAQEYPTIRERLETDPEWYNAKYAGWWVYGQCTSMGGDWQRKVCKSNVILSPDLNSSGIVNFRVDTLATCLALSSRLSSVRVVSGDWRRTLTRACLSRRVHGIFLDPPYSNFKGKYRDDEAVHLQVAKWAITEGIKSNRRIVSCGYNKDEAHELYTQAGWVVHMWKGSPGFSNKKQDKRECLYLSPHCNPLV